MKHDIFISYRRDGGFETANLIASKLRFAGYRVFLDIHAMHEGDFSIQLEEKVRQCKDFIWVLAPSNIQNEDGSYTKINTLKFRDGVDYYRDEICWAIKYKKNIVPIILNGFEFEEKFPIEITNTIDCYNPQLNLKKLQSVEALKNQYFDAAISELKRYLKSNAIIKWYVFSVIILLFALIAVIFYFYSHDKQYENCDIVVHEKNKHNFEFCGGIVELEINGISLGSQKIYNIEEGVVYTNIEHVNKQSQAIIKFNGEGYIPISDTIKFNNRIDLYIKRDDTYAKYWGTILDETSGFPIDSVKVIIDNRETYTNKDGTFQIKFPIEEQTHFKKMVAYKKGYKPYSNNEIYPRECQFHLKKDKKIYNL